jgi:hypothetical protein
MRYSVNKQRFGYGAGSSRDWPGPNTLSGDPDMGYAANQEYYDQESGKEKEKGRDTHSIISLAHFVFNKGKVMTTESDVIWSVIIVYVWFRICVQAVAICAIICFVAILIFQRVCRWIFGGRAIRRSKYN